MAFNREEDRTEQEDQLLELLRRLAGSRGGDVNDFEQEYVEPTANENYGYINKPRGLGFLGLAPVPGAKMASMALNGAINMGNNQAIRTAQRMLGLPADQHPSPVKDALKSPKDGFIGNMPIADKSYPVGFEAQTADNKTTLTPTEARMRSMLNGADTQKTVQKSNKMDDDDSHFHAGLGLAKTPDGFRHIDDPDLPTRNMAALDYDLEGKGRSQVPSSGIGNKVADVVTDLLGPGYGVTVTSGQEPEGATPVGTAHRHPGGFAADLKITDPQGRPLSLDTPQDKQAIQDVAQGMAARYGANFGMGPEYMGNQTMHIDTMDLNQYPGGAEWASTGKAWAGTLDEARQTGVMPERYYDVQNPPTPSSRPTSTMIAENPEKAEANSPFSAIMSTPSSSSKFTVDPNRFKDVTDEQKELMGMTLAGEIDPGKTDLTTEAGRREAMGIMSTMENRAPKYGGIEEAITAPNQYSTWNNDTAASTAANNYKANKSTYDTLVSDYISNPENNLGFTSYHANYVNPGWGTDLQNKETIGPHTFGFLSEYSKPEANTSTMVSPHTVFNTSASYAPHMSGMVSEVNANRFSEPQTKANTPATTSTPSETRETSSASRGFSGGSGSGSGGSSNTGSSMTGTSMNSGKDKDDKASNSFSGGRSY